MSQLSFSLMDLVDILGSLPWHLMTRVIALALVWLVTCLVQGHRKGHILAVLILSSGKPLWYQGKDAFGVHSYIFSRTG